MPDDRCPIVVRVQSETFQIEDEIKRLTADNRNIGAVVTFTGLCRDENGQLAALELEHYPGMAERQLQRICEQAASRWALQAVTIIHRFGVIPVGDPIVLVLTASPHRQAGFDGANYLMDFLKTDAPFWKREHLSDGTTGKWIEARQSDDLSKARWHINE